MSSELYGGQDPIALDTPLKWEDVGDQRTKTDVARTILHNLRKLPVATWDELVPGWADTNAHWQLSMLPMHTLRAMRWEVAKEMAKR